MHKTSRFFRLFILLMIILAQPAMQASAALSRCRIDPHFHLSNGDMVTVTLDIGTDVSNVRNIHYILHVPAGVTVTKVTYTAQAEQKAINETFAVYQDSPAKTYTTDTIVTTQNRSKVEVTVYTRVNGVNEKSISGYSGRYLVATLIRK